MDAQMRLEGSQTPHGYAQAFSRAPRFLGDDLALAALRMGSPQPLSKRLSLRGHLVQLRFGPGREAFAALLSPPSPFGHRASSGHPVQPRAAPLQISPSPTHTGHQLPALMLLPAISQGGIKITGAFPSASSYLSREHPAGLCLPWSAMPLCGERLLWGPQPSLTTLQLQGPRPGFTTLQLWGQPPRQTCCGGEKGARGGLTPASHRAHPSPPHLAQRHSGDQLLSAGRGEKRERTDRRLSNGQLSE